MERRPSFACPRTGRSPSDHRVPLAHAPTLAPAVLETSNRSSGSTCGAILVACAPSRGEGRPSCARATSNVTGRVTCCALNSGSPPGTLDVKTRSGAPTGRCHDVRVRARRTLSAPHARCKGPTDLHGCLRRNRAKPHSAYPASSGIFAPLARHEMRRLRPLATPHRARLQPERRGGSIRRSEMLSPRSVRENHHQDSEKIESGATVAAKNLGIYPGSPELGSWSLSAVREAADAAQVPPRDPGLRESRSGSGRLVPRRTAGGPRTRETALGDHPPPEASSSFR